MTIDTPQLLDALDSVISIPLVPFVGGAIDFDGHAKNIDYLMRNNNLSDGRPRVISIAGTSLVHHIAYSDQVKLLDIAGQRMAVAGVLMAAVVPNPLPAAADLIAQLAALQRPPDVYLIMPLGGTYGPPGLYETMMAFADESARKHGARFLYYYRRPRDREMIIRLIQDSPQFVGVKIGTNEDDVLPFVEALDAQEQDSDLGHWRSLNCCGGNGRERDILRALTSWWRAPRTRSTMRSAAWISKPPARLKTIFRPWRRSASCRNAPTIIPPSWKRSTAPASTMWSVAAAVPSIRASRSKSPAKSRASWLALSIIIREC